MSFRGSGSRALFGVILCLAGLPANAQTLTLDPFASSSVTTRTGTTTVEGSNLSFYKQGTAVDGGGFEASVIIEPGFILFENGAIGMGAYSLIASSTRLSISVTNVSDKPIRFDSFESVIIPAGFGYFITQLGPSCTPLAPTDCSQFAPGRATANLLRRPGDLPPGLELSRVGFDFQVDVDGSTQYAVQAGLGLVYDPLTKTNQLVEAFGEAPTLLNGWTLATVEGDSGAVGYAWDATPFSFAMPDPWLGAGETRVVTYNSTVFVETWANVPVVSSITMLGYSAFGDPIGRPGGGGSEQFAPLGAEAFASAQAQGAVSGIQVGQFRFVTPYFRNGRLYLPPEGQSVVVPEPGTWALLITGFGFVGSALRRRPTLPA